MSDFIPFKEFHKNTNASYQQLLRTFHKVRKGADSPLSEDEDYRYEGKDDVRGRTGILFVNPVLIFPKLKKQRINLMSVESPTIPDEISVVSRETEMKSSESKEKKDNSKNSISSDSNVVSDESKVKSNDTTDKEIIRALINQLGKKDEQITAKDSQIKDLTSAMGMMEANRHELQTQLKDASNKLFLLSKGEQSKTSNEDAGEMVDKIPEDVKRVDADEPPAIFHRHDEEADQTPPEDAEKDFVYPTDPNPPSEEATHTEANFGAEQTADEPRPEY